MFSPATLENAIANGDTRAISVINVHTNESATVTFKRNGYYDAEGLKQLSWILRDYRRDQATNMSPRLFDILWEVHQEAGSNEPFHALSGYRSPATNAMLRRSSRLVAEHSQHMLGKAMDSFLPDVPVAKMRAIAMRLQMGGVGFYPTSGSPFVHIDAGGVRSWPRMSREQLASLFPDGRTVHLPRDGHPLEGYEQARADILAHGGTVAGVTTSDDATAVAYNSSGPRKSLWSTLFGGGADEDEDRAEAASAAGSGTRGRTRRQPSQVASNGPNVPVTTNGDDNGAHALIMAQADGGETATMPTPSQAIDTRFGRRGGRRGAPAEATAPVATTQVAMAMPQAQAGVTFAARTAAAKADADAPTIGAPIALRLDATARAASDAIAAFAPLPPRRPGTLAEVAALVDIPMPPQRPSALDTTGTELALADTAPAPSLGSMVPLDHPLPPSRSAVLALTVPQSETDRLATGSIRPTIADASPTRPGNARPTVSTSEHERLDALFASVALVPSRIPKVQIKVASAVRASLPGPATREIVAPPAPAAGHFGMTQPASTPNHFSGKAIVTPTSLGFTKTQ